MKYISNQYNKLGGITMKILNKILISSCIMSTLITPTSVFAGETYFPVIEGFTIVEDGIMPCLAITDRPTINNGDMRYFLNPANNQPFFLLSGTKVQFDLEFANSSYCEIGIVDTSNRLIGNFIVKGSRYGEATLSVPSTQGYKFYIRNYGIDPLSIKKFEVKTI